MSGIGVILLCLWWNGKNESKNCGWVILGPFKLN